ncbi:MAG TPA: methylenetetrahydrofolate reductase [Streptosporangiaceae bacterium]|nr:methylenetetrahydrofolate reductase [Streptosporangiaceae bacterium]
MSRGTLRRVATLLAHHPRYEVLPTASTEQSVLQWVPRDVVVTVTASPAKGLEPTLELAGRLAAQGYTAVPHLSARLVKDQAHLTDIVERLRAAGITDIFVPAGDADPPAGPFSSALDLLEELDQMGRPFANVGITGYPQSHPVIGDDVTIQAMWDKRRYATYLVSNLCFDQRTLRQWVRRIRSRGVTLPLYVGLAGPIERTRLLKMAAKAGVAESSRFMARHGEWFVRLGAPGAYSPERLLGDVSSALTAADAGVDGLHIFTFNQVQQTEQWRQELLERASVPRAS